MSIITKICDALHAADIPAYLPGKAEGVCKAAHAVVSDAGRQQQGRTTGRRIILVTVYVPADRPLDLSGTLVKAEEALLTVREIRRTGEISPEAIDDDKKAYCASIEFSALCAI